ncbi:MAG: deoxynucleoside kinase [Bacilli bacterium]|nr:deoxynucleoside kinase [Bacilli bacterium]
MEKGKLIVVEGACDGIGKTTQYQLLGQHLKKDGYEIINHHFPSYNTYQGKAVELYLKGEYGQPSELSPYFINSLYANDRAITWLTELKPKFESGSIVLLDRYTTSSLIYQSALIEDLEQKKAFIDYVCEFEYLKLGIPKPDNVIFLHAPFDLVTEIRNARKQNEGILNDIHESNLEFMKKVYKSAMFIADYLGWNKVACNNGNEMKSIEEIHAEVYQLIKKR